MGITWINVDPGQYFFSDHGMRASHLRVKANLITFHNEIFSLEEFIYLSSLFTKVFIVTVDKPSNDDLGIIGVEVSVYFQIFLINAFELVFQQIHLVFLTLSCLKLILPLAIMFQFSLRALVRRDRYKFICSS